MLLRLSWKRLALRSRLSNLTPYPNEIGVAVFRNPDFLCRNARRALRNFQCGARDALVHHKNLA